MNKDSRGHLATRPQSPLLVLLLLLYIPSSGEFTTFKGKRKTSQGKSSCRTKGGQDWLPFLRIPVPGLSVDPRPQKSRALRVAFPELLKGIPYYRGVADLACLLSPALRPHTILLNQDLLAGELTTGT